MPIKQVYTSSPGVYRQNLGSGYDYWAGDPVDRNRLYDEYIAWPAGVGVLENPESPSGYEILVWCVNWARWNGGANTLIMKFDPLTGAFLGHDTRTPGLFIGGMSNGAKGTIWAIGSGLVPSGIFYKFNPTTFAFDQVHAADYYEDVSFFSQIPNAAFCVDADEDIALFFNGSANAGAGQIAVHKESTGEFLRVINVCGVIDGLFMTDDRRAYATSEDGILTLFDYTTGQVLSVLHHGVSGHTRKWAWDRIAKRLLAFNRTPDVLPEGTATVFVSGHYPTPEATGITAPVPLQAPWAGRRVEWYARIYGGAAEGIPGVVVNFALGQTTGAVMTPAQQTTDQNGTARTFVTSSLAGDNTLTATAEA